MTEASCPSRVLQQRLVWCGDPGPGPGTRGGKDVQDVECSECRWGQAVPCSSMRDRLGQGLKSIHRPSTQQAWIRTLSSATRKQLAQQPPVPGKLVSRDRVPGRARWSLLCSASKISGHWAIRCHHPVMVEGRGTKAINSLICSGFFWILPDS